VRPGWLAMSDSSEHGSCQALLASEGGSSPVELLQMLRCDDSQLPDDGRRPDLRSTVHVKSTVPCCGLNRLRIGSSIAQPTHLCVQCALRAPGPEAVSFWCQMAGVVLSKDTFILTLRLEQNR
jgi:hypothetical protein